MKKKYIILNFSHGNGPPLRTAEVAIAINDELESRGHDRMGIIVPWVYRIRQKTIFEENFGELLKRHPDEFVFDKNFEPLLRDLLFYESVSYGDWLTHYTKSYAEVEKKVQKYIASGIEGETWAGKSVKVSFDNISVCVSRYPIVHFGIKRSYYVSFAYNSEIIERAFGEGIIDVPEMVLKAGADIYTGIEKRHKLHFIAEPATFSWDKNRKKRYETEMTTPLNIVRNIKPPFWKFLSKGVYVTITGIPGMERLFEEIKSEGLSIYTHKTGLIKRSKRAKPTEVMNHKNLLLHFSRIGWGSAWLSFLTETPLIALPYDEGDDLEVYFNNIALEKLGIGRVYRGESIKELLGWATEYKSNVRKIKEDLMKKYGTLDGAKYTAKKIVSDYIEDE